MLPSQQLDSLPLLKFDRDICINNCRKQFDSCCYGYQVQKYMDHPHVWILNFFGIFKNQRLQAYVVFDSEFWVLAVKGFFFNFLVFGRKMELKNWEKKTKPGMTMILVLDVPRKDQRSSFWWCIDWKIFHFSSGND